jgi:SpoIIAA-like
MLQKLNGLPSYVAAVRATGEVSKDDYERILVPELDRVSSQHGHIHFLMVLETPVKEFSLGAWTQDIVEGVKHYRGWKKVAVVTDQTGIEKLVGALSAIVPGESKGFPLARLEEAKTWVAAEQ